MSKGFFDRPGQRKIHRKSMPTLGGVAICISFLVAMFMAFQFAPLYIQEFSHKFIGLCIAVFIIIGLGIIDDIRGLNARLKFVVQVLAALVLVIYGLKIAEITNPGGDTISLGIFGLLFTVFWIVGIANAINLLDGLDGLAAGITGIVAFFLFLIAIKQHNFVVAFLASALIGSAIGFLPFNFYPARIFMGNSGSMFLGIILSVIAIEGYQKSKTVIALIVPIIAMGIPIIDTSLAIVRRLITKRRIFQPDKNHIHHHMLIEEKSQRRVVLSLYFLSFCFGLIAFSFTGFKGAFIIIALVLVTLVTFNWMKESGFLKFR